MRTRGHHPAGRHAGRRTGAVALAGLALMAVGTLGAGTPAQAAEQPAPGKGPATGPAKPEKAPAPKPVQDLTAPARPTLGEASTAAGGSISLQVQAESGSALVVREGARVVASASSTGITQTVSWKAGTGPHTYLVVATDAAGNVSDPAPLTLEIDATPPAARNFAVKSGTERDSRSRWGVVTEPGTAYRLLVDGEQVSEGVAEGRVVKELLDLADGDHAVTVELRDETGNLRTLTESVTVDIPTLWVAAKDVSEPNATERSFKVAAAPGTRGFLRIPGAGNERFQLPDGRAEVTIDVEEGSYGAPVVIVADAQDRKGTTELAAFEVDLTAPAVVVEETAGAAERGVLSAAITAGEGDSVRWRLLTESGLVVMSGEFVAEGTPQLLEREVAEGAYELEVTATDANGNATTERMTAPIAAKPMVNPDVVPALTITVALWVLVGLVALLRRRARRLRKLAGDAPAVRGRRAKRAQRLAEHEQAVAEFEQQLAVHEREAEAWEQRRAHLAQLVDVAKGGSVDPVGSGVEPTAGERVFCVLPASLVEMQLHDGVEVPVEVEDGRLVVTSRRIVFDGSERRQWVLDDLEQMRHLGQDRTLMTVSSHETTSGVSYADGDLVRLYLELAMAEATGSTRSVRMMLEQGVRSHELRRPQPPTPVEAAPLSRKAARRAAKAQPVQPVQTVETVETVELVQTVETVEAVELVEPVAATAESVEVPVVVAQSVAQPVAQPAAPAVIGQQGEPVDGELGRKLMLQG